MGFLTISLKAIFVAKRNSTDNFNMGFHSCFNSKVFLNDYILPLVFKCIVCNPYDKYEERSFHEMGRRKTKEAIKTFLYYLFPHLTI